MKSANSITAPVVNSFVGNPVTCFEQGNGNGKSLTVFQSWVGNKCRITVATVPITYGRTLSTLFARMASVKMKGSVVG